MEFVVRPDRHLVGQQELTPIMQSRGHRAWTRRAALAPLLIALAWAGVAPIAYAEDVFMKDGVSACAIFKPNLKPGETVTWQGACANGYGNGPGIAKWTASDGSSVTFEGNFARGKLQGEGQMTASGGDRYVGSYKDGRRDGRGTYVSSNQDRFEGQYKDNQRNGHGVLTLASGQRAEGDWVNGVRVVTAATGPVVSALATPSIAGAVTPLTQATPPSQDTLPLSPATAQPVADSPPPQVTLLVLTPRQLAQQQQVARQEQQQLERQKAQEEQANQQLAQQEQQRQRLADQRRAYERQKTIDAILFLLLLASPLLFVALLWQVKWQPAVTAADSVGSWIERRAAKASERTGYFVAFVERPTLWCARKLFEFTSTMSDQFLKAGVQLALCLYLIGFVLFLAYVITVIVITIAMIVFGFYVLGAVLESQSGTSQRNSSSGYTPRPSYAFSDGESRHREGFVGDYTETLDSGGNVVAESRQRESFSGTYTETRDAEGNVIAESRQSEGFLGPYTETRDGDGNLVGESRQREGLLGAFTETRNADGKVVAESREREGLLGPYTEHKRV